MTIQRWGGKPHRKPNNIVLQVLPLFQKKSVLTTDEVRDAFPESSEPNVYRALTLIHIYKMIRHYWIHRDPKTDRYGRAQSGCWELVTEGD